jgi:hypothetical protein
VCVFWHVCCHFILCHDCDSCPTADE